MTTPDTSHTPGWKNRVRLYLITDDSPRSPQDLADTIARAIEGGVTAVQFREKKRPTESRAHALQLVSDVCLRNNTPLLLNADILDATTPNVLLAGIHYSARTLHLAPHYPNHAIGFSAHTLQEAAHAFALGAHFCTISPVYATPSKAGILKPVGIAAIRELRLSMPTATLVALGGVNATNAAECMDAGADGVAVIRSIMDAPDPTAAAKKLRLTVENHICR